MKPPFKNIEEVVPGDWYDEEEIVAVKNWGFAVDLHLRSGRVKMFESGVIILIIPAANAVEVIK